MDLDYVVRTASLLGAPGTLLAAFVHPEDAAAFVWIAGEGAQVFYKDRDLVWTEGSEIYSAAESYDGAAEIMIERIP